MKDSEGGRLVLRSQSVAALGPGELSGNRISEGWERIWALWIQVKAEAWEDPLPLWLPAPLNRNAALGFSLGDMAPPFGLTFFFFLGFLKVCVSTSEWAVKSSLWESDGIHRSIPGLKVTT